MNEVQYFFCLSSSSRCNVAFECVGTQMWYTSTLAYLSARNLLHVTKTWIYSITVVSRLGICAVTNSAKSKDWKLVFEIDGPTRKHKHKSESPDKGITWCITDSTCASTYMGIITLTCSPWKMSIKGKLEVVDATVWETGHIDMAHFLVSQLAVEDYINALHLPKCLPWHAGFSSTLFFKAADYHCLSLSTSQKKKIKIVSFHNCE